jgi:hypothetical protein
MKNVEKRIMENTRMRYEITTVTLKRNRWRKELK